MNHLNLYFGRHLGWVYQQYKQWLRLARYVSQNGLIIGGLRNFSLVLGPLCLLPWLIINETRVTLLDFKNS